MSRAKWLVRAVGDDRDDRDGRDDGDGGVDGDDGNDAEARTRSRRRIACA